MTAKLIEMFESERAVLFVAAGFEERALAYLDQCATARRRFWKVVVIEYQPFNERNRVERALDLARMSSQMPAERILFSRYEPNDSERMTVQALAEIVQGRPCAVDVSGMSRFLVVILCHALARLGRLSWIVYTEPKEYSPREDEFQKSLAAAPVVESLVFQTTGLYGIRSVPDLTTATMQNAPELLVACPTFQPAFMRALITELSPAKLLLLEGVPATPEHAWRREAVRRLNPFAFSLAADVFPVLTDSIDATAEALARIFEQYKYTHRMVVAPAASKLSAVGVALARRDREFEVLYPTATGFSDPYTTGVRCSRVYEVT